MGSANSTAAANSAGRFNFWAPVTVFVVACATAGNLLCQFWDQADHLWHSLHHDRNAHYAQGLAIGMSLRSLDVVSLFREVERMQSWGLLHPLLEGLLQLVAGPNYRLAVLPSLAGWVGCVVFGFLLARRMASSYGNLAGLFASTLILASPAHHAFATDVMLESLGASLTLASLYFYMVYIQQDTGRAGAHLGACWALLFFCKANYWLLVSIALVLSEAWRRRAALGLFLREHRREIMPALVSQLRHPLTWLILGPALLGVYILKAGAISVPLGTAMLSLRSHHALVHIAFAFLCLRCWLWWRRGGREWLALWPHAPRRAMLIATLPIAIWFLIPKRLGAFLWFISPANTDQKTRAYRPLEGVSFYWQGFLDDYLATPSLCWLVAGLAALAWLGCRRMKPGAGAVLSFLCLAMVLTVLHPMLKNRFLHSWVAASWVVAGAGFAYVLRVIFGNHERLARGIGIACVGALALYLAPAFVAPGRAQESGVQPHLPTFFEITRSYEPHVDPVHRVQIVCSQIESHGLRWVHLEKAPRPALVGMDIPGFNLNNHDPQAIRKWLKNTKADALVLVDLGANSRFASGLPPLPFEVLEESLREHGVFECARQWDVAPGERVSLWTRTNVAQSER
jgi:hypothetical protein